MAQRAPAIGCIKPYQKAGSGPTSRAERWSARAVFPAYACRRNAEVAKAAVTLDHLRQKGEAVVQGFYRRE
jgi:hypothetical protein